MSLHPSRPLRQYMLAWGVAAVVLLGAVFSYLWYAPARAIATQVGERHTASPPSAPATLPAATNDPPVSIDNADLCHQTDWAKAKSKDFLSINCVGKEVPAYDKRLEYVYSLDQVKNWSTIKRDDPRLQDCAGLQQCEERAQSFDTPRPLPTPRLTDPRPMPVEKKSSHGQATNWTSASCESVTASWESEDPRLSTTTCDGLGLLECSHIKRCLGLHDINLGPGSSKVEP